MNLNRRRFLRTGSMLGAAALLRGVSAPLAFGQSKQQLGSGIEPVVPRGVRSDPLYNLTSDMFRENLNTKFSLSLGDVKLGALVLIEVNDLNPSTVREHLTNGRECFSLVFKGSRNLPLRQETYAIEQSNLGSFQLLIVPGKTGDPSGRHYEAVINRLFP